MSNWAISIQQRTLHTTGRRRREDLRYTGTRPPTVRHARLLHPPREWGRGRGLLEWEEPTPRAPKEEPGTKEEPGDKEEPGVSSIARLVWTNIFVCSSVLATLFFVLVFVEALR